MKTKYFFYLALSAFLFTACEKSGDDESKGDELSVKKEVFGGYAQKGPFVSGSSVTILELKPNLDQTGRTYFTTIADNSGSFELKNVELNSHYADLKVDGYYFNEISGKTSIGQMTLYALVDVKDVNSANVNVLTHLEKSRVEYLVKQEKKNFSDAKKQAQREVLAIFGFEPSENSFEELDLTDNAALLAISCILQGYLSTGEMMELMAKIGADIKVDGVLNDTNLGSKLMNNAYAISLSINNVRNNLVAKYAELDNNVIIPDFEKYIQSFLDSELYPQTPLITYSATGMFGDNILSDSVTFMKIGVNYSLKADVSEGLSLRIVLKSSGVEYSMEHPPIPLINWNIKQKDYIYEDRCYKYLENEYTIIESGKIGDLKIQRVPVLCEGGIPYLTIEYYENGSTTPTKSKTLEVR